MIWFVLSCIVIFLTFAILLPVQILILRKRVEDLERERDWIKHQLTNRTQHSGDPQTVPPPLPHSESSTEPHSVQIIATQTPISQPQETAAPVPPPIPTQAAASSQATQASPPPIPTPATSQKPRISQTQRDIQLIARWAPVAGGLFAMVALVFFAVHYIDSIHPWIRFTLLLGCCGLLYGIGVFLVKKQFPLSGNVLMGTGLSALYLTSLAAYILQPVKITDSIWIAGILQAVALAIIFADSLRRKQEILALCALVFGFFSTLLLYREGVFSGILPSTLVFTLIGIALYQTQKWVSTALATLCLGSLVYIWFSLVCSDTSNSAGTSIVDAFLILGFPILQGVLGMAILYPLPNKQPTISLRIGLLATSVILGALMNYWYTHSGVYQNHNFSWFVWIAIPCLAGWAVLSYHCKHYLYTGLGTLLSAMLVTAWVFEQTPGFTASLLITALAALFWTLQRMLVSIRLIHLAFVLTIFSTLGHLIYQAVTLYPHLATGWILASGKFNWQIPKFHLIWIALAAMLSYCKPLPQKYFIQHGIEPLIQMVLGAGGIVISALIMKQDFLSSILILVTSLWLLEIRSTRSNFYAMVLPLLMGMLYLIPAWQDFSPDWTWTISGNLFLLLLWGLFVQKSKERIFYGVLALLSTLLFTPHVSQGSLILLPPLLAFLFLWKKMPFEEWNFVPAATLLFILTNLPSGSPTPFSSGELSLFLNPLFLNLLNMDWRPDFIYPDYLCIPMLLGICWKVSTDPLQVFAFRSRYNVQPAWLFGLALIFWTTAILLHFNQYLIKPYLPKFSPAFILIALPVLFMLPKKRCGLDHAPWFTLIAIVIALSFFWMPRSPLEAPLLTFAILGMGFWVIYALRRKRSPYIERASAIVASLALIALIKLPLYYPDYTWVSRWVALCSAAYLVLGLKANLKIWRIYGLGLFGIVIIWVLAVDLKDNLTRILAFAGLAVICVVVGLLYQKYRAKLESQTKPT